MNAIKPSFLKSPRTTLRAALLAAAMASLALLAACSSKKPQQAVNPTVPVTVASVVQRTVPVQVRAIGNVEAYSTVGVKSQVNGQLIGVHFTEGQDVKQGQLLFTLDPSSFAADLKRAQANLIQDEAKARNAQVEAVRYGKLVQEGVVAKEQADQVQTNYEALQAAVNADKAAVDYYKVQLAYTKIYSPLVGRTGSLKLHLGNVVKANADDAMIIINQVEPIYVDFSVPQQSLPEIKEYSAGGKLKVEAAIPTQEDRPEVGTLSFIDNTVDLNTGTIKLKGTFVNQARRLWPGQFVNVAVTLTEKPNAIVVPSQAIQTGQQGPYVFVIRPDLTAESRLVSTGRNIDGQVVVEKGLQPGEKVVTDGQIRLVPGSKVEIKGGSIQAQETKP